MNNEPKSSNEIVATRQPEDSKTNKDAMQTERFEHEVTIDVGGKQPDLTELDKSSAEFQALVKKEINKEITCLIFDYAGHSIS